MLFINNYGFIAITFTSFKESNILARALGRGNSPPLQMTLQGGEQRGKHLGKVNDAHRRARCSLKQFSHMGATTCVRIVIDASFLTEKIWKQTKNIHE